MKIIAYIASAILGLLFLMASVMFLFNLAPDQPAPPEGSLMALFMGALVPSGYLTFVKVLELAGGILVLVPKTRNYGLLVLGPIIINILAFHYFITAGEGLFHPFLILICISALFLLWYERKAFLGLLR